MSNSRREVVYTNSIGYKMKIHQQNYSLITHCCWMLKNAKICLLRSISCTNTQNLETHTDCVIENLHLWTFNRTDTQSDCRVNICGCLGSRCWFKWSLPRRWKGRASVSPLGFGVIEIATCLLTAGGKQLLASMKIIIQVPWRMLSISKNTLPFKCASKCGSFVYERHSCKCAFTYGVVKVL